MAYDRSSINKFVQNQGGSLSNLGASPIYTGVSKPATGNVYSPPAANPPQAVEGFDWANDYIKQFGNGSQAQNQPQVGTHISDPGPWGPSNPSPQFQPGRPIDRFSPGGPVGGSPYQVNPTPQFQTNPVNSRFTQTNPQFTTLGSLGQPNQQAQYQNAIRNAVMQQRIRMMMKQRGMGNIRRLGVR